MANTQYNEEDHRELNCWVCELHRRVELESLETRCHGPADGSTLYMTCKAN